MDLNTIFIIAAVVVILLVVILVVVLLKMSSTTSDSTNKKMTTKQELQELRLYVMTLDLPKQVEKGIGKDDLLKAAKASFMVYKKLDVKEFRSAQLENKEWHSWQISILIKLYKTDREFFILDQEEVFPGFLNNISQTDLDHLMREMISKYKQNVNINRTKDDLCKDLIWSARDMSIVFKFLSNYKN